jgi:hypothetical protein
MSTRWVTAACVRSGLVAVLLFSALPSGSPGSLRGVFGSAVALAAGQGGGTGGKGTPTSASKAKETPRTPWGDPDLQGSWSTDSAYAIPMQRPPQFAGRAELNDEEFKAKVERDTKARKTAESIGDGSIGAISSDAAWLTKTFRQTSLVVEPADGRIPPLTPEAQKKQALAPRGTYGNGPLDGPEDFGLYDRCISLGVVGSVTPKIYGNGHRIIQGPGYVAFLNEMIHEHRVIPLDGRPHVGKDIRAYMGDSRGHWEGNTLVVETTNLNGRPNYSGAKVVERFTRLEPDLLRYEALIDDPATYTRPFKISIPLVAPPGYQVLNYDCHEGNKALMQALGGERAEDRALEADLKKGIVRARKPVQNGLGVGGSPTAPVVSEADPR